MKMPSYPSLVLALIITILTASSGIAIHKLSLVNEYHEARISMYKIRTAILYANLAIRDAALSPRVDIREDELYKMEFTRITATNAFTNLSSAKLLPKERLIVNKLRKERHEYRNAQNNYVSVIRNRYIKGTNGTKYHEERWAAAVPYNVLMHRYIDQLDDLISLSHKSSDKARQDAITSILTALAVSIGAVGFAIYKFFK